MGSQHNVGDLLARLAGDLRPTSPAQAPELEELQRIAADALAAGLVPAMAAGLADGGGQPPLAAPAGAALADPASAVLIHRRTVPLANHPAAVPNWAKGLRAGRTLGPFTNPAGSPVWFDLFPVVRQVRLVRTAGGAPFLTLPIELVFRLPARPQSQPQFAVPRGSVWFASELVDPAAPAGSWTGLRVTGGTLRFSGAVTQSNDEVVVPLGVTVDLTAQPEQQAQDPGAGPGGDARDAQVAVPGEFRLVVGAAAPAPFEVKATERARLLAFGFATDLTPTGAPVRYDDTLRALAVPLAAAATPFRPASVKAKEFRLAGRAPVTAAAWCLPVAVLDPSRLGDADGCGSLALWLDDGLTGRWAGQKTPVQLHAAVVEADAHYLVLSARTATGERVEQRPALPSGEDGRIDLRWRTTFPVLFDSVASGFEAVVTEAELSAVFDRPVDLRGERLNLHASTALVVFVASAAGTFVLVEGALDQTPSGAIAFQLVNALLRVSRPRVVVIYGQYDGTKLDPAAVLLEYALLGLVPTLPDPYAATYGDLVRALDQPVGVLLSILGWTGGTSTFDFRLPAGGGVANLRELSRTPSTGPLPLDGNNELQSHRGNGWGEALKAVGSALSFETRPNLILLDVSTSADQYGVAYSTVTDRRDVAATGVGGEQLAIENMSLEVDSRHVALVTLPAVQWEAVETVHDPGPNPLPTWVSFNNSGVPTVIGVPTADLVPVHPRAALGVLVENFTHPSPLPTQARFTLPFGMIAVGRLKGIDPAEPRWTSVLLNQPAHGDLQGARQLRIDAHDDSIGPDQSPALAGWTAQLPLAQPGDYSVLGVVVTNTFNTYVGASGVRPMVPVTRIDLSGYGESLFSEWRNPFQGPDDTVAVLKAQFDVLIGRTALEVVQVRSILFPYGVVVVRTITIERRNNAAVTRSDSGWQAVGDGLYYFPGTPIVTHPGVVPRITGVVNIRDTGQFITVGGKQMGAVYFDGDLDLDGAPTNPDGSSRLVPARGQFGCIQVTAGALIPPSAYADLINQAGSLGGPIDTSINVGGGPQVVHLQRVDVGVTQGMGGPEFAMAAWGAPAFPGGGQWSVLRINGPGQAPTAVPRDKGVPLVRSGPAGNPPDPSRPYRFADPGDVDDPANPAHDYAILHAMGTQRALFPRPKIEATDPTRITSTQTGTIADPYGLGTSTGPYPEPDKTVPFPTANWALRVDNNGQYRLDLPSPFAPSVGRRTMRQAGSVKSDVDYSAAQVTYEVDTSQAVPWRFRLDNTTKIMNASALGDVIALKANVVAAAGVETAFEHPNLQLGGGLSVVQDLLTILADIGISGTLSALMTNKWALKVALTIPFVDATGNAFQIPPAPDPVPDIKFDDTEVKVELDVAPDADKASFQMGGHPMFAVKQFPGLYAVAIIKFEIELSTDLGTVYALTLGVGIAYELKAEPFTFKGLFALTIFGFIGDTVLGFGIGFLLSLEAAIEPIVSVKLSLEGQLAIVDACKGTGNETVFGAAKLTLSVEISICLVFSISFELSTTGSQILSGPGAPCTLPDVLPNAS